MVIKEILDTDEKYQDQDAESKMKAISSSSSSTNSSNFSVVDDDKNLILAMIAKSNELKEQLVTAAEEAKAKSAKQEKEIEELKQLLLKVGLGL